jgi:hypothetical protein
MQPHAITAKRPRIAALDRTKGLLVLVMVAYHVMSIATTAERDDFAWLRFVSSAFIVLTGWVVAMSAAADAKANLVLMRRGGKVLLLFLGLNAAIWATGWGHPHKTLGAVLPLLDRLWLVMTQAPSHLASFLILLPIGYLLVTAPIALRLHTQHPWATPASLLLALAVAAFPAITEASAALSFWLFGWIGLAAGLLWQRRRAALLSGVNTLPALEPQPNLRQALTSAVALVAMLALSARMQSSIAAQVVAVGGVLWAMGSLVHAWPAPAWVAASLTLLGRYSLLAYVAQIVLIHLAFRGMGMQRIGLNLQAALLMAATSAGVLAICWLTQRMRQRSATADRSYRLIFA